VTPNIEIITFTIGGRDKYLTECIAHIISHGRFHTKDFSPVIKQYVICQGSQAKITCEIDEIDRLKQSFYDVEIIELPENIGIASGLNMIIPRLTAPIIIKMDDDCKIQSSNFFLHIMAVNKLNPNLVFSPFPVGLINNLGGPRRSADRYVQYSEEADTYYTFRPVDHVGGFARVTPLHALKGCKFEPDLKPGISGNEDGQYSEYCREHGIKMAYLENALIVEHNESTLGQHARYGEAYFNGRF